MAIIKKSIEIGGKTITFETGRMAKQAQGSILVRCEDTMVLVTACVSGKTREGVDFFPLTVDYLEKMYAAGKIPGGFFKREGRPRDEEILISRLIDRSIRPLFPDGYYQDVQIIANVLSSDQVEEPDVLALTAASAALFLAPSPFMGPIAGVRVGRLNGTLLINPSVAERRDCDIDMVVSCSEEAIVMVEGGADEVDEKDMIEALFFAHQEAQKLIALQHELRALNRTPVVEFIPPAVDETLKARVFLVAQKELTLAYQQKEKLARYEALSQAKKNITETLHKEDPSLKERTKEIHQFIELLKYQFVREQIVTTGRRIDGRDFTTVRPITIEAGLLPRVHGSALFTRGETQALVTTTMGTKQDEQKIDNLLGSSAKQFMLQYNFPPFSVGEVKPLRSPGRREVGHGALAERAITRVWNRCKPEDYPYTLRLVSDILESNGSSSMATVCGSSLALMDAGVPFATPVAGVAMGLIKEQAHIAVLSDILGDEDHLGDMDFKVAGTTRGITAIQMDIKITGLDRAIITQALHQAKEARQHILGEMAKVINTPRQEMSPYAPRIVTIHIKQEQIKDVIGPGGKIIKDIIARTNVQIDITDDGKINIASSDSHAVEHAISIIQDITRTAEIGHIYLGKVQKIVEFGAFIEIFSGTEGLCHISEISDKRIRAVDDVLQEGDEVLVKVLDIDPKSGKIRLSRREVLNEDIEKYRK